ncbi:MAG TPA: ABC transporter permease [Pseudonocardia sp.]|nr:ABC transporter permease [Pseudonocardia sp.]
MLAPGVTGPSSGPAAPEPGAFAGTGARKQWRTVADRFLRHRAAMAGLVLFVLLLAFAFLGPLLWTASLDAGGEAKVPPSPAHPFGTDRIGHDMLASVISGTRYSLQIALVVAAVSTVLGVVLGALAGYLRGWVDQAVSRLIDLVLVIPQLVVVAVLARNSFSVVPGQTSSNWLTVALILALTVSWLPIARTIRGMVLSLREKEFVEAAQAAGASTSRIVFRHILPNTVDVIIVNATITIAGAVLLESALSFVGLGVKRPDASLGLLINENKNELVTLPWLFWFPFVFIVLISLSVNFIGDGLRDAFDPRQKRVGQKRVGRKRGDRKRAAGAAG